MSFSTEARLAYEDAIVEIRNYAWEGPLDDVVLDEEGVFGLSLSPVPKGSRAVFGTVSARSEFEDIGKVLFRPPYMPMHCRNQGGHQRLMMCTVRPMPGKSAFGPLALMLAETKPALDIRDDGLTRTLQLLALEARAPGFAAEAMVQALVTQMLVGFSRMCRFDPKIEAMSKGGLAGWQLLRIDEALHDTDGAAPRVADLAAMVGVSPRHLLRAFRARTGKAVVRYIAEVRARRAQELLGSSQLTIKQVAARCGYASAAAFATAFRRETGQSPGAFRRGLRI